MTNKLTKQIRIMELTKMALADKSYKEIHARAFQMTGSKVTANKYMLEIIARAEKVQAIRRRAEAKQ